MAMKRLNLRKRNMFTEFDLYMMLLDPAHVDFETIIRLEERT